MSLSLFRRPDFRFGIGHSLRKLFQPEGFLLRAFQFVEYPVDLFCGGYLRGQFLRFRAGSIAADGYLFRRFFFRFN